MYQEVSSSTNNQPYIRRALLLWTFHKSSNLIGETTWRYITPDPYTSSPPPRHQVFSPGIDEPQPHNHHSVHSILQDDFNSTWDDTSHLGPHSHISANNLIDPFVQTYDSHLNQPHGQAHGPILRSPINFNLNGEQYNPHFPYYNTDTTHLQTDANSLSQESDNTMSTNTLVDFDTQHGLDIHLSYDSVVGVGGIDVDDFGVEREPWLSTPTRVGMGVGVSVEEAFANEALGGEAWGYDETLEQGGMNVGHGVWPDDQGDMGVVGYVGHQMQGGSISVGTN